MRGEIFDGKNIAYKTNGCRLFPARYNIIYAISVTSLRGASFAQSIVYLREAAIILSYFARSSSYICEKTGSGAGISSERQISEKVRFIYFFDKTYLSPCSYTSRNTFSRNIIVLGLPETRLP